jgi:hypothetical protein
VFSLLSSLYEDPSICTIHGNSGSSHFSVLEGVEIWGTEFCDPMKSFYLWWSGETDNIEYFQKACSHHVSKLFPKNAPYVFLMLFPIAPHFYLLSFAQNSWLCVGVWFGQVTLGFRWLNFRAWVNQQHLHWYYHGKIQICMYSVAFVHCPYPVVTLESVANPLGCKQVSDFYFSKFRCWVIAACITRGFRD